MKELQTWQFENPQPNNVAPNLAQPHSAGTLPAFGERLHYRIGYMHGDGTCGPPHAHRECKTSRPRPPRRQRGTARGPARARRRRRLCAPPTAARECGWRMLSSGRALRVEAGAGARHGPRHGRLPVRSCTQACNPRDHACKCSKAGSA